MSQVTLIAGRGVPLVGNDIDTDRIIPARFLKSITFDGLGEHLFRDDRTQAQGQHPLDQPQYQGAEILVVNRNFGCGSSREHAPQALSRWGIRAIVGESFAEIFFGNCVALGLPCVMATPVEVQQLQEWLAANPQTSISVNLEAMQVQYENVTIPVQMSRDVQNMFIGGTWDACGQLMAQSHQIQQIATRLPYIRWSQTVAS
ncbi:3-isopropylmalate dehydratase small subunit [Thermocoleostomius sinensis]|uniref:3-isopropylmalate dehydratase small subunit n=1 Tax=Thermocoleostomius sinensis A174 TaxID=2016057 RepID=A0A9E9C5U0_9CYAN|nr:3-isopropylmalate dehydratase small subunit [Thermocoleostomius sinensis]WAL61531.1 3-isopropylmalate dehydratase small subunit [Thermocoleostomius sinensis A174]